MNQSARHHVTFPYMKRLSWGIVCLECLNKRYAREHVISVAMFSIDSHADSGGVPPRVPPGSQRPWLGTGRDHH